SFPTRRSSDLHFDLNRSQVRVHVAQAASAPFKGGRESFSTLPECLYGIPESPGRLKLIRSDFHGLRPYHTENARSRPISEAKQCRAWLVLGWETAWEYQVL